MKQELEKIYKKENDVFGYPQEYKKVKLYPILLKDIGHQDIFYRIFARPKNYIPDIEILKMSYLKFLVCVVYQTISNDPEDMVKKIVDLMSYITKSNVSLLYQKTGSDGHRSLNLKIKIGDVEIDENDFDNIREIVLQQNNLSIEYVEEYNPELEEHLAFLNRSRSNIDMADEIFSFCAIMKIGLKDIEDYTLFQFNNIFEKLVTLKDFDLYKPLLVSGQISFKDGGDGGIKHYLYHSKKGGRYDSILIDKDTFMEKNKEVFNSVS
jgi:hypothetical protein